MAWYDACVDADLHPELTDPRLPVWCGVDASVKRDSTAIVAVTFDQSAEGPSRLASHFPALPDDPLDFEKTIERTLLELNRRFWVREVPIRSVPDVGERAEAFCPGCTNGEVSTNDG